LPECLDDFIDECNPVRVIDVFVGALDLAEMSFEGLSQRQLVDRRTAGGGRLSLSGWRASAISLHKRGRWQADKALLDQRLSKLSAPH
jgi:hypothetical protein